MNNVPDTASRVFPPHATLHITLDEFKQLYNEVHHGLHLIACTESHEAQAHFQRVLKDLERHVIPRNEQAAKVRRHGKQQSQSVLWDHFYHSKEIASKFTGRHSGGYCNYCIIARQKKPVLRDPNRIEESRVNSSLVANIEDPGKPKDPRDEICKNMPQYRATDGMRSHLRTCKHVPDHVREELSEELYDMENSQKSARNLASG